MTNRWHIVARPEAPLNQLLLSIIAHYPAYRALLPHLASPPAPRLCEERRKERRSNLGRRGRPVIEQSPPLIVRQAHYERPPVPSAHGEPVEPSTVRVSNAHTLSAHNNGEDGSLSQRRRAALTLSAAERTLGVWDYTPGSAVAVSLDASGCVGMPGTGKPAHSSRASLATWLRASSLSM